MLSINAFAIVTLVFWFGGGEGIEKPSFRTELGEAESVTIMTDVSSGYKMGKTDPETWRNSEAWKLYLTQLDLSGNLYYNKKNQPLVNDDDY